MHAEETASNPLPDGAFDALVVDARDGTDDLGRSTQRLELTIVAGEFKGEVVTILTGEPLGAEVDLIGMPATIRVADGDPAVTIDR